jgi:hypothetical protein
MIDSASAPHVLPATSATGIPAIQPSSITQPLRAGRLERDMADDALLVSVG